MTERKKILLRLDPAVHDAVARWAADELRSTNSQVEFLLRRALAEAGRMPKDAGSPVRRGRPRKSDADTGRGAGGEGAASQGAGSGQGATDAVDGTVHETTDGGRHGGRDGERAGDGGADGEGSGGGDVAGDAGGGGGRSARGPGDDGGVDPETA